MRNSLFFRLPCPPLAKRGSLTHSQALALSKRARDVTAPPVALNRCAIRLAGHQSPRQVSYAGWDRLAESGASEVSPGCAGWNRLDLTCYYLAMTYYYLVKGAGYYPYFKTTLACNKSQRERNVLNV